MNKKIFPFPPVRPMDPVYIQDVLEKKEVNASIISGIVAALNDYNTKCNQAVDELEIALNDLLGVSK